jgi:hypothetical protein
MKKITKFFLNLVKTNNMSSPRRQLKVGPSRAPEQPCPPGQYRWRNFFASGCKPAAEDRRRLGIGGKVLWARIRGEPVPAGLEAGADGLYGGYGGYGGSSSRRRGSYSSRRGSYSNRRGGNSYRRGGYDY